MKEFLLRSTLVALLVLSAAALKMSTLRKELLHQEPNFAPRATRRLPLKYMVQQVDNFNTQHYGTFEMAYYENDEFFANHGPLIVFIGGEWTINQASILGGQQHDLAREFNGTLLYPEHRFYGHSFPTEDSTTANLRLLSVEQALADLASFIVQIKAKQPRYAQSKVLLVGCSYAASMATWMRQLYPHLTVGAWASSGPILAKADFVEYKEIVGASIRNIGGRDCYNRIEAGIAAAEKLIADERIAEVRELFRLCDDFGTTDPRDFNAMFSLLSDIFAGIVQYHNGPQRSIQTACDSLLENTNEPSTDLSEFARFMRNKIFAKADEDDCLEGYQADIVQLRNVTHTSNDMMRQWIYQTCTEFGWFQTSGSEYQPFGSSFAVDLFYDICTDVYGEHIGRESVLGDIERKNVLLGGLNTNVRNVYFTHGVVDPWRAMGVQEDLNAYSPANVVPGHAAHCADLAASLDTDSEEMRRSRLRARTLVREWLDED